MGINDDARNNYKYKIHFDNIPLGIKQLNKFDFNCRFFDINEIKFWASTPEEVKQLIDANKFGL